MRISTGARRPLTAQEAVSRSTSASSAARLAGFYHPLGSCHDRRTALPETCGLFEDMGELEDAQVLPATAYDLDTYGQSLLCETAGHRYSGQPRNRHVVTALHPIYIRLHLHPVYLRYIALLHVEGRDLAHGRHEEIVAFHECPHAVIEFCPLALGASHVRAAQAYALLDVPAYGLLHGLPMPPSQL